MAATAITSADVENNILTIEVQLSEDDDKIVGYDAEIHEGKYDTEHSIIRVLFNPENKADSVYKTYLLIANAEVNKIDITTTGTYTEGLTVKNDLGKIKTDNPFYPFGPLAKKRANLKISADEWIGKTITDVEVYLDWKDQPDNFKEHYQHYISEYLNITPPATFKAIYDGTNKTPLVTGKNGQNRFRVLSSYIGNLKTVTQSVADATIEEVEDAEELPPQYYSRKERTGRKDRTGRKKSQDKSRPYEQEMLPDLYYNHSQTSDLQQADQNAASQLDTAAVDSGISEGVIPQDQQMFFTNAGVTFKHFLPTQTSYVPKATDNYFIQLSLQNNFLHDAFARIYTYHALEELSLPNNPYTPYAENLKVKVTTSETISSTKNQVVLYHEYPFGIQKVKRSNLSLMPTPENGGQLYIGIEQAIADQNIQLLCQIEEGSENPDAIDEFGLATVTWQYLHNNTWNNLKPTYLLKDQTDSFLKAGLVAFTVPKQFGDNTLFEEDYLWIRATISTTYDTVSKFANIHAQGVEVKFLNDENTLEHLEKGMPAETISKLEDRLATVKKVTQPYASFDGLPKESDLDFYRRVSERLRHKNRAITLWDYEHLVLQEFNYLHKIKCLNHSTSKSFKAPGEVLLVAIPNIIDQNVFDIYKPKLSQTKLNAIKTYINELNTLHVTANVVSPLYEAVKITLGAKFYEGLDANYYAKQLQQDIAQYLSPWAFDKNQPISFGNALYASEVIFYIEKLDYVDYIKDFKMLHDGGETDEIIPTDQKSILTSVVPEMHAVTAITTTEC